MGMLEKSTKNGNEKKKRNTVLTFAFYPIPEPKTRGVKNRPSLFTGRPPGAFVKAIIPEDP